MTAKVFKLILFFLFQYSFFHSHSLNDSSKVHNTNPCSIHRLQIPNAFSPNNDGNNDLLCLQGWETCVSSFEIKIFNRWGEEIFQSEDPNFCWNGIYKGAPLNEGIYFFVLIAKNLEGLPIKQTGNIALLK